MKIQQEILIDQLKKDVAVLLQCVETFRAERDALLVLPAPGKWTIAQILEHLNSYGRFYLPAIDKALSVSTSKRAAWFNSGFWGNYFTNLLRPKNVFEIKNKMSAPKNHVPGEHLDADKVVNEFIEQQRRLLQLLDRSKEKSLNSIRVPISISKLIRLKLGDTFRFFIAHEQRHFVQARNTLKTIGIATDKFPAILQVA